MHACASFRTSLNTDTNDKSSPSKLYEKMEKEKRNEPHQTDTLKCKDRISILDELRKKNLGRIIIGHLNINSLRNKFDELKSIIHGKVDVFVVSETKIDESFPTCQFKIDGFSTPFRLDRNKEEGDIIVYIRSDIPCKRLKCQLSNDVEGLFLELNLRKKKWVIFVGYNPKKQRIFHFLENIGTSLDKFIETFDNLLLIGDFNSEMEEEDTKEFCETYNLVNLIKDSTCFKSVQNPTSIDVILTNKSNSFCNTCTIKTGLSDHHKMTITVLKSYYKKITPSVISYRSYKN